MMLQEMLIIPGTVDAEMRRALTVVALMLHPKFDTVIQPGKSKESCVLCSLAVRDFLWQAGWKDAKVTTVYLMVVSHDAKGDEVWSLGVGDHTNIPTVEPKPQNTAKRWSGHIVVEVPSAGILIDTTLYQAARPQHWPTLPGMAAVPLQGGPMSYGLEPAAGLMAEQPGGGGVSLVWLRQPNTAWLTAPDAERSRRMPVVKAMLKALPRST
jgi:hypothetical protein